MLLWVIIKTTDNGAKCLLTGLAIILRNQDRWEHYKLQINLFNNEGPHSVLSRSRLLLHAATQHIQYVLNHFYLNFTDGWNMSKKHILVRLCADKNQNNTLYHGIKLISKQAKCWSFPSCYSFMTKTWSALLDHAYSARLTRTNDSGPSAYMLTAVYHPHPGNDCVINPQPFFKLLLTAVGENGTQTVSAHLSLKQCWGGFDPDWLSVIVIVKDRAIVGSYRQWILFLNTLCLK